MTILCGVTHKLAILLRGPTGIGKTTIARALLRKLGATLQEPIVLDHGWGYGERRFNGGTGRYEDLRGHQDDVIVVELGWGEPAGEGFQGATRNPAEWFNILQQEGRDLFLIRLEADSAELVRRAEHRCRPRARDCALHWQGRYDKDPDLVSLPSRLGTMEHVIDTTYMSVEDAATEILARTRAHSESP